ncbi:MAG TPA: hypothetical protein PKH69_08215 [Thiobacillaceae bacterium]|nr:hypothetical protein [Thiobacillaceae bacterium]HNU63916.1 hypothetical protein [Thiobacillaceae bacterium]
MKRGHRLEDPRSIRKLWRGFLVLLALSVLAGALIDPKPHFAIEGWFGFHALYGFVACLVMIVGAKVLGWCLKKPDTYYARDGHDD